MFFTRFEKLDSYGQLVRNHRAMEAVERGCSFGIEWVLSFLLYLYVWLAPCWDGEVDPGTDKVLPPKPCMVARNSVIELHQLARESAWRTRWSDEPHQYWLYRRRVWWQCFVTCLVTPLRPCGNMLMRHDREGVKVEPRFEPITRIHTRIWSQLALGDRLAEAQAFASPEEQMDALGELVSEALMALPLRLLKMHLTYLFDRDSIHQRQKLDRDVVFLHRVELFRLRTELMLNDACGCTKFPHTGRRRPNPVLCASCNQRLAFTRRMIQRRGGQADAYLPTVLQQHLSVKRLWEPYILRVGREREKARLAAAEVRCRWRVKFEQTPEEPRWRRVWLVARSLKTAWNSFMWHEFLPIQTVQAGDGCVCHMV